MYVYIKMSIAMEKKRTEAVKNAPSSCNCKWGREQIYENAVGQESISVLLLPN